MACTLASVTEPPVSRVEREDGRRLFGLDPAAYATGRPGYPVELFEILVERCGLAPGTPTLEIGAGAGQATRELLARGADPLAAVEPDPRLAAYLVERFGASVHVIHAPFEEAPLGRSSFVLATAATSWHWVDQERGLARLADLLHPGGWWAAWWNVFHDPAGEPDALFHALDRILPIPTCATGNPQSTRAEAFLLDRDARSRDLKANGFDDVEVAELRWVLALDPQRASALFGTFSPVLALSPDERERVLGEIERVIVDRFDGLFERRCVTILYTARRA